MADAFLVLSLYGVVRDWRAPLVAREQQLQRVVDLMLLTGSIAGAVFLAQKRPRE
jgi:hypothetical protein